MIPPPSFVKGNKSFWKTWEVFPALTTALESLYLDPIVMNAVSLKAIERFIVLVYDRTSNVNSVNRAREKRFCKHYIYQ